MKPAVEVEVKAEAEAEAKEGQSSFANQLMRRVASGAFLFKLAQQSQSSLFSSQLAGTNIALVKLSLV